MGLYDAAKAKGVAEWDCQEQMIKQQGKQRERIFFFPFSDFVVIVNYIYKGTYILALSYGAYTGARPKRGVKM